jgi:hypothetical protein
MIPYSAGSTKPINIKSNKTHDKNREYHKELRLTASAQGH